MSTPEQRAQIALARMDYAKQNLSPGSGDIDGAPVTAPDGTVLDWGTEAGWEAFKRANGIYPYGSELQGGVRFPPNGTDAPPWAKRLMGGHLTPAERMR